MKLDLFDWLALILVVIGAINWGLLGLLNVDLVALIFGGQMEFVSKVIYSIIGLAGAYMIYMLTKLKRA
ncbi:hypothetical protein OXPF_40620 [Oxobacter pfennigii]|uniref:DUF378 domain-containing protein n=1 Tax=Oxobacter pfennigii TaxID=36849 RepID=A0A0P8YRQ1_9CLOT|nr:DUF378 domain-containing protein [Oxobacter pfennigii]KPU42277.1 hypothetical protein OXPF_40620 [Oxobacter pfennigii]